MAVDLCPESPPPAQQQQQQPPPTQPAQSATTESGAQGAQSIAAAAQPPPPPPQQQQQHSDPDEVDISQHYYAPQTTARPLPSMDHTPGATPPEADALRQLMMAVDRSGGAGNHSSGPGRPLHPASMEDGPSNPPGMEDDTMVRMMMQMMGGPAGGGPPFGPGAQGGGGALPFGEPQQQQQQRAAGPQMQQMQPDRYALLWRFLHTAAALGLGLYIALWTGFTGAQTERERVEARARGGGGGEEEEEERLDPRRRFFWAFATAEAVLLTTRFFVDRGRARPGGFLWSLAGFLPRPFRGNVEAVLRYGPMFSTVRSDILVCIFVLGGCSWLRTG